MESKITAISPKAIDVIKADLREAVKSVEEKYGVAITFGNASYTPEHFGMKTQVAVTDVDGNAKDEEAETFKKMAQFYGLKPEWLHQSFEQNGKTFEISGLAVRSRKYPILAKQTSYGSGQGETFKFKTDSIKLIMSSKITA